MNRLKQQGGGGTSFLLFLNSRRSHFPPILLAISLLGLYLRTMAPGLTWANGGSDGGDLITAAATGGIAHPTGYPLYLLLARLFQLLPVGSLAFRTNLMSAVCTVLGAVLVYRIVSRSLVTTGTIPSWPAGMAAGYAYGLAPLIWSQAVITEVYALHSLLVVLILYLYIQPVPVSSSSQKRLDSWRGLVLGLGLGNHITTIFLVPVALWVGSVNEQTVPEETSGLKQRWFGNLKADRAALLRQLTWFGAGLCVYLIIPLRALAHPPVNWGNPVTLERFWWLVSGGVYPGYYLQTSLPEIWEQLQTGAALLLQQFGLPGVVTGLIGLVVFFTRSRLYIFTVWTAVASLAFAMFYNSVDSYIYLIPMFISFAIWIGLGMAGLVNLFAQRYSIFGLGIGLLLIGYFLVRPISYMTQVDASRDQQAEAFGKEVLAAVPANAIVFAKGDRAIFVLWYYHFALHQRKDLSVLATDLLHFDWYQENLKSTYPSLILPEPFPWPETITTVNPSRATCQVQYTDYTEIKCTEPLMAP